MAKSVVQNVNVKVHVHEKKPKKKKKGKRKAKRQTLNANGMLGLAMYQQNANLNASSWYRDNVMPKPEPKADPKQPEKNEILTPNEKIEPKKEPKKEKKKHNPGGGIQQHNPGGGVQQQQRHPYYSEGESYAPQRRRTQLLSGSDSTPFQSPYRSASEHSHSTPFLSASEHSDSTPQRTQRFHSMSSSARAAEWTRRNLTDAGWGRAAMRPGAPANFRFSPAQIDAIRYTDDYYGRRNNNSMDDIVDANLNESGDSETGALSPRTNSCRRAGTCAALATAATTGSLYGAKYALDSASNYAYYLKDYATDYAQDTYLTKSGATLTEVPTRKFNTTHSCSELRMSDMVGKRVVRRCLPDAPPDGIQSQSQVSIRNEAESLPRTYKYAEMDESNKALYKSLFFNNPNEAFLSGGMVNQAPGGTEVAAPNSMASTNLYSTEVLDTTHAGDSLRAVSAANNQVGRMMQSAEGSASLSSPVEKFAFG